MKNKFIFGLVIGIIISSVTVYAANKYSSSDITYKNTTVENALNDLYANTLKTEYEGLKFKRNENDQLEYYYNNTKIEPLYWYGYTPYGLDVWGEQNASAYITYNPKTFTLTRKNTVTNSRCVGGLTSFLKYDFTKYSKFHIIVNSSTVNFNMKYVNYKGPVGTNYDNENKPKLLQVTKKVEETTEYVADLSSVTSTSYASIEVWCQNGDIEVSAMWLE